jgi:hypothetical protein
MNGRLKKERYKDEIRKESIEQIKRKEEKECRN